MSNLKIKLDTSKYRLPTQKDIDNAKKFILKRENTAKSLETLIDNILVDAAGEIAQICLKYNIPAKDFKMTANKQMFAEVEKVMDSIDEEIMSLIQEYSLKVTDSEARKKMLALYISSLGRGNNNLQKTLDGYLYRYLYDLEAIIASMKLAMENNANFSPSTAISKIKSSQHSIYNTPEVNYAMSAKNLAIMQATYIRTHGNHSSDGVPLSSVGVSNSNANNVVNMAKNTMAMAWMRGQLMEFESMGAEYYYQLRGSSYPCTVCDNDVGLHRGSVSNEEYPHPSCKCFRVPIYTVEQLENTKNY